MPTPRDLRNAESNIRLMPNHPIENETVLSAYLEYRSSTGRRRWRFETRRVRRYQLMRIAESLPVPLTEVTEHHIFAWQATLRGEPETVAGYTSAARGLFNWMAARAQPRLITVDPTIALERPEVPPGVPRPMLDRHYDLALACSLSDPEMYIWLGLMGCSGLRCCEVAWLQVGDVEPLADDSALLHLEGKGGKRRTVPVGALLSLTMRPFLQSRGPVFTRQSDGRPHTPHAVSRRVSKFLQGIGIPAPHRAHSLRHRFGTDYHALDVDLFRQAILMGHSSVETTRRYTQVSPIEAAQYVEKLTRSRLGRRRQPGTRGSWEAAA